MSAIHPSRNNFDALRILAASAVIYGHAHPLGKVADVGVLGTSVQALAVKIFFIISGYLVTKSWIADPSWRYLLKRTLRIFPGLILLLLITVLVVGPLLTSEPLRAYFASPGTWRYVIYNAALYPVYSLSDLFVTNPYPSAVNGSLWSLPVEFLMYLILPVVYGVSRIDGTNRLLVTFAIALCAVSLYVLRVATRVEPVIIYGTGLPSVLDVAPYFFVGSLYAATSLGKSLSPAVALFLVAAAALFQPTTPFSMELTLYVVLPYAALAFATCSTRLLADAGRWGDPSYGIYLYGFLVQQTVYRFGGDRMSPVENTLISLPIAALLALLSWHLVEKRALLLKPRKFVYRAVELKEKIE